VSTFHARLELAPLAADLWSSVEALVDTGSTLSKAPEELLEAIGVRPSGTRQFTMANNQVIDREVGRVLVRIDGREAPDLVMFGEPDEQPIIGARTLEGLFLAVDPVNKRLVPVAGLELTARP
jgi:predicted aspartyl protease